jgi:hypothetical protein
MFILNNKRINIYASHTDADGVTYANLTNPEVRERLGVTEVADPLPPEDYSDDTYYRTEQDEAPFVVYTRKPQEQIEQARRAKVLAEIDALERETLLPRVAREFMLIQFQAVAAAQGVDPMENFGYRKVKELGDKINALRDSL